MKTISENNLEKKYKLVADTIRLYPNQLKQAWDEIGYLQIPQSYKNVENIVFCGMGGSALGARIVDSFAYDRLRIPLEIFNDYNLPNYVNKNTLVIVCSYSGTTEEVIEFTYQAITKGAKIFGITIGETLGELLKKQKIPSYIFEPKYNPSLQPRMSTGYMIGAPLALFNKLGFLNVSEDEIEDAISVSFKELTELHENAPSEKNLALSFANKLKGKIPVLVASSHLFGTAHTIKNQFNESAKTFSVLFEIPELNHHLMEGLSNPTKQKELLKFIFFSSELYKEKVQKRFQVTANVLDKNNIEHLTFKPSSDKQLSQILETLIFGSFCVYYLTKIYKIDPLEIPWVNYFKDQLEKK